jgi:phosphoadenosine phosphosulfate reductase
MLNRMQEKKIQDSYDVLRLASELSKTYYQKPLIITYSGGKDSDVLLQLAIECLAPGDFEVLNSHTSVDAPETVWYIRDKFKELNAMGIKATVQIPRYKDGTQKTIWNLIIKKGIPPTRINRYCCAELKETSTPNRFIAVGVREAESTGRMGRNSFAVLGRQKSSALYFDTDHIRDVFSDAERERESRCKA